MNKYAFNPRQRVGKLEIIREVSIEEREYRRKRFYLCLCDCGITSQIEVKKLVHTPVPACSRCAIIMRKERFNTYKLERKPNTSYYERNQEDTLKEIDSLLAARERNFDEI